MKVQKFKRGQIWWYETGNNYNGSIPGKTRPVVIISNELANEHSTCLLGIPCTTAAKNDLPTHTSFLYRWNIFNCISRKHDGSK